LSIVFLLLANFERSAVAHIVPAAIQAPMTTLVAGATVAAFWLKPEAIGDGRRLDEWLPALAGRNDPLELRCEQV
jgi:hypothetical protein